MTTERVELRSELDLQTAMLRCRQFAIQAGLADLNVQKLVTATSELTRNVHKYAFGEGLVLMSVCLIRNSEWVQVEVIDTGPGIADLKAAMQDHFSTSGTLGLGLPGVQRLVDAFEIQTEIGQGTHVTIRMRCSNHGAFPAR